MKTRRLHRLFGLILLLPFIGWSVTGLVFFIKPGYAGAYELLQPKTLPLQNAPPVEPHPDWLEFRYLRTILGEHLLVRMPDGWRHLDPRTLAERPLPDGENLKPLLADAISANPPRYGNIVEVTGNRAVTDTGVEVTVDWNRLAVRQRGPDTDRIDALYRVHYLQWTGVARVDRFLGIGGLILLIAMTVLGARLAFSSRQSGGS